jgi:hypothetical protein
MKSKWIHTSVLLLMVGTIWAQADLPTAPNEATPEVTGQQNADLQNANLLIAPNGATRKLTGQQNNVVSYGMRVSTSYDDGLRYASQTAGSMIYSVQPQLALNISRRRWNSSIDYLPVFSYSNHDVSGYNSISHAVGIGLEDRVTKRLTLHVQNTFTFTSNPFDSLRATSELGEFGVLERPNSSILPVDAPRHMEQVGTTLSYAMDARTSVGIVGNFMDLKYEKIKSNDPLPSSLLDSLSGSASAFYNRQVSLRSSMGVRYVFQRLEFGGGLTKTDAQSLLYTYSLSFTPKMMASAFIGPEHSDTRSDLSGSQGFVARSAQWSWVGGLTLDLAGQRNSAGGSVVRQISDGGGFGGSVRLDSFNFKASHHTAHTSTISGFVNYNKNRGLLPVKGLVRSFDYFAAGASYSRAIMPHLSFELSYWRIRQSEFVDLRKSPFGNRVTVSLAYDMSRPLGR